LCSCYQKKRKKKELLVFLLLMELISTINLLTIVLLLFVVSKIWKACWILLLRPLMLSKRFKKQGISGPKYKILYGNLSEIKKMKKEADLCVLDPNSNDIFPRVFPQYHQWMSQYGTVFYPSCFFFLLFIDEDYLTHT